mmetsp:Transcript_10105/g.17268  ORF Transcript_10105/g.17268 Transcript_10105/m.17268 type:complete len:409 (-) Transcript_10105:8-1234(-)
MNASSPSFLPSRHLGEDCAPYTQTDSSTRLCLNTSGCRLSHGGINCKWCKCKGCRFCDELTEVLPSTPSLSPILTPPPSLSAPSLHATQRRTQSNAIARAFPSPEGHWDCGKHPAWYDEERNQRTSAVLAKNELAAALSGKWLVFYGDSSSRMLFHLLVGALSFGWTEWPRHLSEGRLQSKGSDAPTLWECKDTHPGRPSCRHVPTCLDNHRTDCIEEAFVGDVRLTCAWDDFGESTQPHAILHAHVANATVSPDALLVSLGAWWAMSRHNESAAWAQAVELQLDRFDRLFRDSPSLSSRCGPRKIFASTTACSRGGAEPDASSLVVDKFNRIAFNRIRATSRWDWFDREVIAATVCDPEFDCAGGGRRFNSRFHPTGKALNVMLNRLVQRIRAPAPASASSSDPCSW